MGAAPIVVLVVLAIVVLGLVLLRRASSDPWNDGTFTSVSTPGESALEERRYALLDPKLTLAEYVEAFRIIEPPRLDEDGQSAVFANILRQRGQDPSDYEVEAEWNFENVADQHQVGELTYDFIDSMHGDVVYAALYVLPGGLAVGVAGPKYEIEPNGFILKDWTVDQLIAEAEDLLLTVMDGADLEDRLSEWDDEEWEAPDGDTVTRSGLAELRAKLEAIKAG